MTMFRNFAASLSRRSGGYPWLCCENTTFSPLKSLCRQGVCGAAGAIENFFKKIWPNGEAKSVSCVFSYRPPLLRGK
jgi:hypothetical protein